MAHWKLCPNEEVDHYWRYGSDAEVMDLTARFGLRDLLASALLAGEERQMNKPFSTPVKIMAGALTGHRMTSLPETIQLGLEAANCLSSDLAAKKKLRAGDEIWALRADAKLVAVLSVNDGIITELRGLRNSERLGSCIPDLALFCERANLRVSNNITICLADLLPAANQTEPSDSDENDLMRLLLVA